MRHETVVHGWQTVVWYHRCNPWREERPERFRLNRRRVREERERLVKRPKVDYPRRREYFSWSDYTYFS